MAGLFHALVGYLWQFSEVVLVNIVLSGDNAIVIAMATLQLQPKQRRKAALYGTLVAAALRIALIFFVGRAILLPYVQAVGGVLLAYMALSLLLQRSGGEDDQKGRVPNRLLSAIGIIILADLTMSLDNVIALAGVAAGNEVVLVTGLLLSIALIMFASTWLAQIMARVRWLQFAGAAVLAWTAGGMIGRDPGVGQWLNVSPAWPIASTVFIVGVLYVLIQLFRYSE